MLLGKKFRNLLGGHFGWQNGSILWCLWLYQQAREGSTAGCLGFLDLRPKNVSCTRLADTNHALTSYEMGTTNPTVFVRSPIFPLNSCYPLGLKLCISRKAIELHTNLPLPVGTQQDTTSLPTKMVVNLVPHPKPRPFRKYYYTFLYVVNSHFQWFILVLLYPVQGLFC